MFSAVQTQAAWAYATDTNLLASGGNRVETATTGSGIYAGRKGPIVYLQSQRNETTILYAKIYKKGKSGKDILIFLVDIFKYCKKVIRVGKN